MNKQGLVSLLLTEKISAEVKRRGKNYAKGYEKGIDLAIKLIKASEDEPQKPAIPQFVADWIEYCKRHNFTLFGCLDPENGFESLVNESFEGDVRKCIRWCRRESNIFARAWLYGYTVEKEKRYLVEMKDLETGFNFLNRHKIENRWLFSSKNETVTYKACHTRKELEEAGFGWVFDCEGIEVEEVQDDSKI